MLQVAVENWPLRVPFRISGSTVLNLDVVVVTLAQHGHSGRGEAAGVDYRKDDDIPTMMHRIEAIRTSIEAGSDRETLQRLLPPGGARNCPRLRTVGTRGETIRDARHGRSRRLSEPQP